MTDTPAVGPGWRPIVAELAEQLAAIDPGYRVVQVKQKMGGLRYYFEPSRPDRLRPMYARVEAAEKKALTTCELCGRPGTLHVRRHYLQTLCASCAEERGFSAAASSDPDD